MGQQNAKEQSKERQIALSEALTKLSSVHSQCFYNGTICTDDSPKGLYMLKMALYPSLNFLKYVVYILLNQIPGLLKMCIKLNLMMHVFDRKKVYMHFT